MKLVMVKRMKSGCIRSIDVMDQNAPMTYPRRDLGCFGKIGAKESEERKGVWRSLIFNTLKYAG